MRAIAALALATLVAWPALAFAQTDPQSTLENAQPDGPGRAITWDKVWPRHPTDAEIADAAERFKKTVWSPGEGGQWVEHTFVTFSEKKTIKAHTLSGEMGLSGDPETGDAVFLEWKGTADYSVFANTGGSLPIPLEGEEEAGVSDIQPAAGIEMLIWNVTDQRFDFDIAAAGARSRDELYTQFGYADGWMTEGADDSGRPLPWQTAVGGMAGVMAAAAAIAGSAASARGKRKKLDPNEHVGYVLELSTKRIELASANSDTLTVRVWKVLASGRVEPADDATVTLTAPAGVQISPASGPSPLEATVWQAGDVAPGAAITVTANASKGSTSDRVELVAEAESALELTLQPEGRGAIKPNGRDVAHVVATLKPGPGAPTEPTALEAARQSIRFAKPPSTEWLNVGDEVDAPNGKAAPISASAPDPDHPGTPPESVRVVATAQLGAKPLQAALSVPIERPPSIDCRPDVVEFSAGTAATAEVLVWIEDPGGLEWAFTSKWRENDRALAVVEIRRETPSTAVVTLTEDAAKLPDIGRAEEASTLVLVGTGEGWDPLERYCKVIVAREGIFIDPVGRNPDGTFHVEARGEGKPTDIDVRVYVRDEAGVVAKAPEAAESVEWTPGGPENTPGRTALGFPEFTIEPLGLVGVEDPAARFRFTMGRKLPTGPEPIAAVLHAQVPGFDKPEFATDVSLKLLGIDTSPFSDAWRLERDRCLEIIAEYAPLELQQRFRDLVYERGPLMGAEGLYEMRKRIWSISEGALRKEAADWMDKAWTYEQIEGVLDWMSYLGDIALGVASGSILGTVGSIGLGMLKPMLVSAMEAYVDGKDLSWWAKQQIVLGVNIVEGQWTDPDFIAHLTGKNKAIVWIAFICYTCVKEWALDPEHSIRNAMLTTLKQLRDQAIISFLRSVTGATPGAAKPGAGAPPPPKGPKAPPLKPGGRKPPAPGSVVKPGQKPARTNPAPGSVSKAPKKPGTSDATTTPKKTPRKNPEPGSVVRPGPDAKKQTPRAKPAKRAPEFDGPDAKTRAKKMSDGIKEKMKPGPDGKPVVDNDTMEKIMRDPDAARELRAKDPEAWKAYDRKRQEVNGKHDAQLKDWIEKNVPEAKGQEIKVETFGTPDGVDRDYRAGIWKKDPNTGKQVFVEIPKEKWAGKSQEIFSEVTGGPKDPAGAAEWSRQRQQLPTDGYHAEASVDMTDQAWTKNEKTGRMERTQVTSNLELTEQGKSTLKDPDGLGKTYETKVAESYHDGNTLDAYKQAEKATHTFTECKTGYMAQDFKMKQTPPEMIKGFQIVEEVAAGRMKPEAGDAALAEAGLGNNLPEFMSKLSGQFAGFKFASK